MTDPAGERDAGPDLPREPRRGPLDPILSNRDGLFSALEERGAAPPRATPERPWAHRRGEPRLLLLFWAVYLLAASGATIMRLPRMGLSDPSFVQAAARALVLLVAVGLALLWPMVRLSQAPPRRPVAAALVDLAALLLPLAAVLWPVTWLGRWDWPVTAALIATLAAWGAALAAFVAAGTAGPAGPRRVGWAAAVALVALAAPALTAAVPAPGAGLGWLPYASPITAVYALTTEPGAAPPAMTSAEWWAALGPLAGAAALWAALAARTTPPVANTPGSV